MGRLPCRIEDEAYFPGQEAWLNHFYPRLDTLFEYFPKNGLLALIDPLRMETEKTRFTEHFHRDADRYRQEADERERPFPEIEGWSLQIQEKVYTPDNLWDIINGAADLYLSYDFRKLHLAEYKDTTGLEVRIEIYHHNTLPVIHCR